MEATPEIEAPHHHRTGNRRLDIILAVSACVVSLVSVFLAIENAIAMRQLVASNSWPFVIVGVTEFSEETNTPALDLVIANKGVGPAKIKTLEVFYQGKPMAGSNALVSAMTGGKSIPILSSRAVGNVLSAKETLKFFAIHTQSIPPSDAQKLAELSRGISIRTCYCSVFDECWLLDRTVRPSKLTEVDECPVAKVPFQ